MIKGLKFKNKVLNFTSDKIDATDENVFTVIIGKNGSGKSTLFQNLILSLLSSNQIDLPITDIKRIYKKPITKIIAVSTTAFDKFPIRKLSEKYKYLGLRGLSSHDYSKSYLSLIIGSFLDSLISSKQERLTNVLNHLGFEGKIKIKLALGLGNNVIRRFSNNNEDQDVLQLMYRLYVKAQLGNEKISDFYFDSNNKSYHHLAYSIKSKPNQNDYFNISELNYLDDTKTIHNKFIEFQKTLDILVSEPFYSHKRIMNLIVENGNIFHEEHLLPITPDISYLLNAGILRLEGVELYKTISNEKVKIENASSGEQSLIISILGIFSAIKDNSIIFIDEPETSLHPEWQERYMHILISTFKSFKNCHFIIATHSPQIISQLEDSNCYVMSMDDGLAKSAISYINKSSDFQLATLFNSPGFSNEYLTRVSLTLFSKIKNTKTIDDNDKKLLNDLKEILTVIRKTDPVYSLIQAVIEASDYYG
ncbi:ATP-binding protein [Budviciaceae bacterium CWB-B4]|uniref:ATP-binding protein n=1 Tax=Limnobaculum xujianqingii TaxID=2738837 RepID=A0A9D7AHB3_9GAMM|nr:ATP-binding protein [Limnobaculum xujianqingii]MBK5072726.1 ATP-binding protein [Limnobaculum xujianqingii]MBK5176035.1 ATP-binding protein [Limnobaculum xujianqingii]